VEYMVEISPDVLCYDCETRNSGFADPIKDKLRIFGCYSYRTKKYYLLTDKEQIQKTINAHKFLVGFNTEGYDELVLKREGIDIQYKIRIDLYDLFKKRAGGMKIKEGMLKDLLMSYSLDFITQTLGLTNKDTAKKEIDYSLFNKESWTEEEIKLIREYTERDLELTKKLYEFCEDYFNSFKVVMSEDDNQKKKYLTDAISVFTYKIMCKELGVTPEFEDVDNQHGEYEGGYVAYPTGEEFKGNLALFDYASLYPNLFIQCNLFSDKCECCQQHEKWHGGGFFKVEGFYCNKKQGKIEQMYKKFYLLRKQYKKDKNPLEYSYKIALNTGYGLTANPKFKRLYNRNTASDCTALGRQCILYTRKRFREEGFKNAFSDTDSIAVQYPEGKTIIDAVELSKKIVLELQRYMPFPW
jgi:DNA polymerase elongation subunit (family B)